LSRLQHQELTAKKLEEEKKQISSTALSLQANLEVRRRTYASYGCLIDGHAKKARGFEGLINIYIGTRLSGRGTSAGVSWCVIFFSLGERFDHNTVNLAVLMFRLM